MCGTPEQVRCRFRAEQLHEDTGRFGELHLHTDADALKPAVHELRAVLNDKYGPTAGWEPCKPGWGCLTGEELWTARRCPLNEMLNLAETRLSALEVRLSELEVDAMTANFDIGAALGT